MAGAYPYLGRRYGTRRGAVATIAGLASTWNPLDKDAGVTLSADLLTAYGPTTASGQSSVRSTNFRTAGKLYFAILRQGNAVNPWLGFGSAAAALSSATGQSTGSASLRVNNGSVFVDNSAQTTSASVAAVGSEVEFALDFTARTWGLYINGALQATYPFPTGSSFAPMCSPYGNTGDLVLRRLSSEFAYAPPTGFTAWG